MVTTLEVVKGKVSKQRADLHPVVGTASQITLCLIIQHDVHAQGHILAKDPCHSICRRSFSAYVIVLDDALFLKYFFRL